MAEPNDESSAERRRSTRAPMARPILFSGTHGPSILRSGQAVDISAGGILIHTPQPELVGRHLELELHPEAGVETGEVIMVKGEVARVEPLIGRSEYAMGVRFLQQSAATDVTGSRLRPATDQEAKDLAGAIQRQLDAMVPAVQLEVSSAARKAAAKKSPRVSTLATRPARRWRKALLLLLLLLVLPAVLGVLLYQAVVKSNVILWRVAAPATTVPAVDESTENLPAPLPDLLDQRLAAIASEGPAYYINRGSYLLVQDKNPAALQAFRSALKETSLTPVQHFVAQLGEAQALAGAGNTTEAIAALEAPFEEHEFVPEPWLALKASFLEALYNQPESPASRAPLVNAFTFRRVAPTKVPPGLGGPENPEVAEIPEGGEESDVRLEVDTNRHLLTVLEDNAIKAVYPVGLGFDGLTAEGLYSITNKIKNPDWYNRGNVVPAGDPANEIGARWIGLSDEAGPTPLGIHGTDDAASIGENLSRGCIRMRPSDVEELFNDVTPGTPVHIRAL